MISVYLFLCLTMVDIPLLLYAQDIMLSLKRQK
jgi:hypothetical protein